MEENDERIARKLQAQFDGEDKKIRLCEERKATMAEKVEDMLPERLINRNNKLEHDIYDCRTDINTDRGQHQISDSESDEDSKTDLIPHLNRTVKVQGTTSDNTSKNLPLCKYGSNCYRKNPSHFQEYCHPIRASTSSDKYKTSEPPRKKRKLETEKKTVARKDQQIEAYKLPFTQRFKYSQPYNLFLNKVFSVKATHTDPLTLVHFDLLNAKMGTLVESLQINFMVDLELVKNIYSVCRVDDKPILIMYGELEGSKKDFPNAVLVHVNMPFQYGVHHSKIMVFQYKEGLRVVIHTANLVPDDWEEKTQGYWISPLFPPLSNGKSSLLDGESETGFKKDFVDYMLSYRSPDMTRWSHIVKLYDFSSCRAIFIGSVPGYHKGGKILQFGHTKVRHLLRKYSKWQSGSASPVIAQCSSIGSLGKDAKSWLTGELGVSLSGGSEASKSTVNVIYPSEDNVKKSSQGYMGGSCLPYNSSTHSKQEWLMQHFYNWSSDCRQRSESMPHIKSYTRTRNDKLQYFILTSANLSKAAWGQFQKQGSQLFIRSYEAGVLLLPKFIINEDSFNYKESGLPLHYDIPLTAYQQGCVPWFKNTEKILPDRFGHYWP